MVVRPTPTQIRPEGWVAMWLHRGREPGDGLADHPPVRSPSPGSGSSPGMETPFLPPRLPRRRRNPGSPRDIPRSPRPTPAPSGHRPLTMRRPSGEYATRVDLTPMSAVTGQLHAADRIPHPHRRSCPAAALREAQPGHSSELAGHAAGRIPHPHRPVMRPADDVAAVGGIRHAHDHPRRPHGRGGRPARRRWPHPTPAPCCHSTR